MRLTNKPDIVLLEQSASARRKITIAKPIPRIYQYPVSTTAKESKLQISRTIFALLGMFWLGFVLPASAQTARLTSNPRTIDVGATTLLDLELETTSQQPIFAAEFSITLPAGVELVVLPGSPPKPDVLVDPRWLASVVKVNGAELNIAVTAGGGESSCSGTCPVASIAVKGVAAGTRVVGFSTTPGANGALSDNQNLSEVRIRTFESASVDVGLPEALPGDFNGDDKVDRSDFLLLIAGWGTTFNRDDFLSLVSNWGRSSN